LQQIDGLREAESAEFYRILFRTASIWHWRYRSLARTIRGRRYTDAIAVHGRRIHFESEP
jgi:hypothetical protein